MMPLLAAHLIGGDSFAKASRGIGPKGAQTIHSASRRRQVPGLSESLRPKTYACDCDTLRDGKEQGHFLDMQS